MGEVLVLRDPSRPCEHEGSGTFGAHLEVEDVVGEPWWSCGGWVDDMGRFFWCPGGREVRLRRQWVCQANPYYMPSLRRCSPDAPHVGDPEYPVGSGNRIGCGWYLRDASTATD